MTNSNYDVLGTDDDPVTESTTASIPWVWIILIWVGLWMAGGGSDDKR